MSVTLSFVDERQFLTVIQSVHAPTDPGPAESPPTDPGPTDSSTEPLHSTTGATPTETS
jgi:hypothetical protein